MAGNNYYSSYQFRYSSGLFGSPGESCHHLFGSLPLLTFHELGRWLKVRNSTLFIPPFKIEKYGQIYINPLELAIDLRKIRAGFYSIIVVHNFQVEDRNPNLRECLAGIYLARHVGGKREEPENYPIECREIETVAGLDTQTGKLFGP
jgi:hypothetical protein